MSLVSRIPLEELWLGTRFMAELPFFLRRPIRRRQAQKALRLRLENRQLLFLNMVRRTIYDFPASIYHRLLRWAGCEAGDLEKLVRQEGIEGALNVLYRQGVYLTVEEFKGRRPVVRGSAQLTVHPRLFQNPALSSHLTIRTSGSRSSGTVVPVDFAYIRSRSINALLGLSAMGGVEWLHAVWGIPGGSALVHLLEFSGFGAHPVRWFSHVDPESPGLHPRYRWSARALRWASILAGMPLPRLQHVPIYDPQRVMSWITKVLRSGEIPHLLTYTSSAVRLCQTAREAGIEMPGAQFTVTGEPVTAVRLAAIRQTGAKAIPRYGSAESGTIGYGCLKPEVADEVHLLHDRLALIQPEERSERIPAGTLFVSTLDPATPFILLNVSLGDQAIMLERNCGCPLQQYGWATHLHSIRSHEKLTCGGMLFTATDIVRVMEETLPQRFGGMATHYQLVEEEDKDGRPCLRLLVHPDVGAVEPRVVAETFLAAISSGNGIERIKALAWRDADLLRVERSPPLATNSGKILHLHLRHPTHYTVSSR